MRYLDHKIPPLLSYLILLFMAILTAWVAFKALAAGVNMLDPFGNGAIESFLVR